MSVVTSVRSRLGIVLLVVLVGIAAGGFLWMRSQEDAGDGAVPAELSSIVLVTVDGLRRDALGVLGGPRATPALDELASGGVSFLQAATSINETIPALAAMMTGLYPVDLWGLEGERRDLCPGATTLAEHLEKQGFTCAAFLGSAEITEGAPSGLDQGFTVFSAGSGESRPARVVMGEALDWLAEQEERCFLWIHLSDPTTPYAAEPEDPEGEIHFPVRPSWKESERLAFLRGRDELEEVVGLYRDRVADVDAAVGQLLAFLDEAGRLEETLVALTATFGESLGEHDIFFDHYGLFEPVVMVPWILRGGVPEGKRIRSLVKTIDLPPTVCGLLGVPPVIEVPLPEARSEDVAPLWGPEGDYSARTREVIIEQAGRLAVAGRTQHSKLIVSLQPSPDYPHLEWQPERMWAYDIQGDPAESVDQSGVPSEFMRHAPEALAARLATRHDPCEK